MAEDKATAAQTATPPRQADGTASPLFPRFDERSGKCPRSRVGGELGGIYFIVLYSWLSVSTGFDQLQAEIFETCYVVTDVHSAGRPTRGGEAGRAALAALSTGRPFRVSFPRTV